MTKKFISIIQIVLGVALLAWLLCHIDRDKILTSLTAAGANWPWVVLGFSLFVICVWSCSVRWQLLLRAQGIVIPVKEALRLFMISHFFNCFMLGSTGGDLVKAYYATRTTPEKKTEAATTVFLDRAIGLFTLIGVMLAVMLSRLQFFLSFPETRKTLWFAAALTAGAVLGLVLAFGRDWTERWPLLKRLCDRSAIGSILNRVYQSSRFCLSRPSLVAQTFLLSFFNQGTYVVIGSVMGKALSIHMSLLDYFSVFPVISVIAAVPATPGGLGTRETATVFLLNIFGVPSATAFTLSILLYAVVTFWSLVGGLVYLAGNVKSEG